MLLKLIAAANACCAVPVNVQGAEAQRKLVLGPPASFDFEALKTLASELAGKPYMSPPMPDPSTVAKMGFDTAKQITPDPDFALYPDGPYPVSLLTVGRLFSKTVRIFRVEGTTSREILYRPEYFRTPPDSPLARLPNSPSPLAGLEFGQAYDRPELRGHEGWARFLGASYFRAVGEADQFGASARGLAVDTAIADREEFPDFTHFWVSEGKTDDDPVALYALLDGPSVVGAYRFLMHRGRATTMDITARLHLRKRIERLGIAPLTSMYWYSETVKGAATDWRPEIHDSDGVAIWTQDGEHLWRPLENPEKLTIATFAADNPRGFGLMQRDKVYDHYLDAVGYEKRPCVWVAPTGTWGTGSLQLVQIPTDNEIYDNIVVMWVPEKPAEIGDVLDYRYDLLWRDADPFPGDLAICVATRLGAGGKQGAPRSTVLRKFVLEFRGCFLATRAADATPEAVLAASPRGTFSHVLVEPSPDGDSELWRVQFDFDPDGVAAAEIHCHLVLAGKALTETWVYTYVPFVSPIR